jgi:drug/metabolite transporter (DMT)-like permease
MLLPRRLLGPLVLVGCFAVTGWHLLTAYGLLYVGGGRAAIIAYTMPIWAALLSAIFLRERLTARRAAALAIGMLAMAILLAPDLGRIGGAPIGVILITGAAISWAIGIVGTKAHDWQIGTFALTGWQLLVGGIPIVVALPIVEGLPDLSHVSTTAWLALTYCVVVGLVFCFSTHVRLIRVLPAMVAALVTLAIPIVGLASSAVLLHEPVGASEFTALLLVLVALSLVLLPTRSAR